MAAIEFTRRYSMAHRLIADPLDKCATPHGHNEIVLVRLAPDRPFQFSPTNMQAPFARLKARWHGFIDDAVDHALQLNDADPLIGFFRAHEPHRLARIMTFPGDPTTEALAAAFWLKLSAFLTAEDLPFTVAALRIEETPTNAVSLDAGSFFPDHCGLPRESWPWRADYSINDFPAHMAR
jgi:6-pyruvoyltetrahydropterin/6-carboxytetrahydropterin synthase